jgi:hypothetical protein
VLISNFRLRRPPWASSCPAGFESTPAMGRVFLVFRSKNGPQAERLERE